MDINNNNALASPTPIKKPTGASDEPGQLGRDAFMKLLVTQLQNQDPLDPMDAREMVTQLSELTSVEQLKAIEYRLTALEVATAGMANMEVAGVVGRTVTADADNMRLGAIGGVEGVFTVEGRATNVTAVVRDASGQAVRTIAMGERFPGQHQISWDGNDDSGARMPAGRYTVEYSAKDSDGNPVNVSTEVQGLVTEISYENGYPELLIGQARVLLGDVTSISM